jgi:hypothetical protein
LKICTKTRFLYPTFAPIFINFVWSVLNDQSLIFLGKAKHFINALLSFIPNPALNLFRLLCEHIYHQIPEAFLIDGLKDAGLLCAGGPLLVITEASAVVQTIIRIDINPPYFFFDN